MRKLYIFLALCLLSAINMRAEKDYLAVLSTDGTILTLYYVDNPEAFRHTLTGYNESYIGKDWVWYFNGICTSGDCFYPEKIVIDSSVRDARPTSTDDFFLYDFDAVLALKGLENINTSQMTDMNSMFSSSGFRYIDISSWDLSNVTDVGSMFGDCEVRTIFCNEDLSTKANITKSKDMFYQYNNQSNIVGGEGTVFDPNHTDKSYARPDGGASKPGYFTRKESHPNYEIYGVFGNGNVFTIYYDNQKSARDGVSLSEWKYSTIDVAPYENERKAVKKAVLDESMKQAFPTDMQGWFFRFENMETIEHLDYLNTMDVENMRRMFYHCYKLKWLDLRRFYTSNVTDMAEMFEDCKALTWIDLSLFHVCSVEDMDEMFKGCDNLRTLYVNTPWFKTEEDWSVYTSTGGPGTNMFLGCTQLVGGNGTAYNASHTNVSYARVDWQNGVGYFTQITSEVFPPEIPSAEEDGMCSVSGTGRFNGIKTSQIFSQDGVVAFVFFDEEGWYYDESGQLIEGSDYAGVYFIYIQPSDINNLQGTHTVEQGSRILEVVGNSTSTYNFSGNVTITMDNNGKYNMTLDLLVDEEEEYDGTISGICDDLSQGLAEIGNPHSANRKFIRDGQLLIECNGKTYNVQGAQVR